MKYKAKIWLLAMGVALVTMAANATTLFKPVGRPPEVFAFNSATMTEPLTSNPYALNSPKVYLIFLGPDWEQNGMPIPAVNSMIADAKEILNSPYLSGLTESPLTRALQLIRASIPRLTRASIRCGLKPTGSSPIRRSPRGIHRQEQETLGLHRSTWLLDTEEGQAVRTPTGQINIPLVLSMSSMI